MIETIVYLVVNLIRTYLCFLFMRIFFVRKNKNIHIEISLYILFFISTSAVYLIWNLPIVTLITNCIFLLVIALYNTRNYIFAVLSVIWIYAMLVFAELLGLFALGKQQFKFEYSEKLPNIIASYVVPLFAFYLTTLITKQFINIKRIKKINFQYNIYILLVPAISIFVIIQILHFDIENRLIMFMLILLIFIINFIVFSLFDIICKYNIENTEKIIFDRQRENYLIQIEQIKMNQEKVKMFKHDIKNHSDTISSLIALKKSDKALCYLENINDRIDEFKYLDQVCHSGNIVIDVNLNSFQNKCLNNSIQANITCSNIPSEFKIIKDFDLNSIISNVLDNAVNASLNIDSELRKATISLKYHKKILMINVANSFDGKIKYNIQNQIMTSHKNNNIHGYGLKIVKSILKKYDGIYEIDMNSNEFKINILMYDN